VSSKPDSDGEAGRDARPETTSSPVLLRNGGGAPPGHVLILDEEAILVPTARYFRALGFTVDTAQEPEEADALLDRQPYDLAILDVSATRHGQPGGLEVLREIRRRDHDTKVVVLGAYISPEVEAEARALGADVVVRKPQPLPDLVQIAYVLIGPRRDRWS
jgi:DNA-binding response OmpR family regulator